MKKIYLLFVMLTLALRYNQVRFFGVDLMQHGIYKFDIVKVVACFIPHRGRGESGPTQMKIWSVAM